MVLGLKNDADVRTLAFCGLYFLLTGVLYTSYADMSTGALCLGWLVVCYLSFIGATATVRGWGDR